MSSDVITNLAKLASILGIDADTARVRITTHTAQFDGVIHIIANKSNIVPLSEFLSMNFGFSTSDYAVVLFPDPTLIARFVEQRRETDTLDTATYAAYAADPDASPIIIAPSAIIAAQFYTPAIPYDATLQAVA